MSQDPTNKANEHSSELFMLLDENLSPGERKRLMDRLSGQPKKQEQLEEVLGTGRLVDHFSIASRDFCPDQDILMAGANNDLGMAKTPLFQKHVDACPFCISDVADFQALTAPTSMELFFKMGKNALENLKNSFGSLLTPAPVPVFRSGASATEKLDSQNKELAFERREDDVHWTVIVRQDEGDGTLMKVSLSRSEQPCQFTTLLFFEGQVIDGRSAKDGTITIEGLKSGSYELVVKENSRRENAWNQMEESTGSIMFEDSVLLNFE